MRDGKSSLQTYQRCFSYPSMDSNSCHFEWNKWIWPMDNGGESSHSKGDFVAIYFPITRPLIYTHKALIPLTFKVRSQNTGRIPPYFPRQYVSFQYGNEMFLYNFISLRRKPFYSGVSPFLIWERHESCIIANKSNQIKYQILQSEADCLMTDTVIVLEPYSRHTR